MRRKFWFRVVTSIGLIGLVLGTVVAGIVQVELDLNQFFYHKALAFMLLGVIAIHLVTNRKALAAYFRVGRPARSRTVKAAGNAHQRPVAAATGVPAGSALATSPVMKSLIDQSVSGATMITSIAGLPSMFATMAIARAASN